MSTPDENAGSKCACPRCGQRVQVPTPPKKTVLGQLVASVPDAPAAIPAQPATPPPIVQPVQPKRSTETRGQALLWAVGIFLLVLIVSMVAVPVLNGIKPRERNARCPICGQEFNIPEHHGIGRMTNDYTCPNCGFGAPAMQLYKKDQLK